MKYKNYCLLCSKKKIQKILPLALFFNVDDNTDVTKNEYYDILSTEDCFKID